MRRAIESREAPCEIGIHQGNFVLKADDVSLCVKLIDGQFPPYDQVIPKDNERAFVIGRVALLDALRRVALMSSDKTWGVQIAIDKGKLRVESDNPDLGAAREEIDVPYKGAPVQIGFNARYFIELLAEIETPEVRVELAGELDPGRGPPGRRQRLRGRRHADAPLRRLRAVASLAHRELSRQSAGGTWSRSTAATRASRLNVLYGRERPGQDERSRGRCTSWRHLPIVPHQPGRRPVRGVGRNPGEPGATWCGGRARLVLDAPGRDRTSAPRRAGRSRWTASRCADGGGASER